MTCSGEAIGVIRGLLAARSRLSAEIDEESATSSPARLTNEWQRGRRARRSAARRAPRSAAWMSS